MSLEILYSLIAMPNTGVGTRESLLDVGLLVVTN
jgi:hypothetical protein